MAKSIKQIIEKARAEGHGVVVRVTKDADGSVHRRVVKIDGVSYRRGTSEGNSALRALMGESLSHKELEQRRRANVGEGPSGSERQRKKHRSAAGANLTKKEKARIRRINKRVREGGHGYKISRKGARAVKKRGGSKELSDQLRRREQASHGDVYSEQVSDFLTSLLSYELHNPKAKKYTDMIRKELHTMGRMSGGRWVFFKGVGLDVNCFYKAWRSSYNINKGGASAGEYRAAAEECVAWLRRGKRTY